MLTFMKESGPIAPKMAHPSSSLPCPAGPDARHGFCRCLPPLFVYTDPDMTAWESFCQAVQRKKVLVFGLGLQGGGTASANTLIRAGAEVRATDTKSRDELRASLEKLDPAIAGTYGGHTLEDIDWADIILKNPAVPYSHPLIQRAVEKGKMVVTESAWTLQFSRNQTVGVTGTRGKTTTSHLIAAILQAAGKNVLLCGNIPEKPALSFLPAIGEETVVVMEISSFHLESSARLQVSPKYAVVTNVSPDHLNRYETVEEYAQTKAAIFAFQKPGDHAFFGTHHEWSAILEGSIPHGVEKHVLTQEDFVRAAQFGSPLPGEHNQENIAFAVVVAKALEVSDDVIATAVAQFNGVPFRLQKVGESDGVTFINDTTATTPTALEKALDAQTEPFVLIAGGTTKHLPIPENLRRKLREKPEKIIWLKGSGTNELHDDDSAVVASLAEAVHHAKEAARQTKARVVLFSPGFASFELFKNEFDRGEQFNRLV